MSSVGTFSDVKSFWKMGTGQALLFGEVMDNWADDTVTVDSALANPVITNQHVESFYNSFDEQLKSQTITGKKNVIIFQCDSRSPGAINSNDTELGKSFMSFSQLCDV